MRLSARTGPPASLVVRAAHAIDPRAGVDGRHDVLVRDGQIAELAAPGTLDPDVASDDLRDVTETIDGDGLHLFPGFVDPHVHLRTPGREDEEDLESGTRAAAAGGFCCVLAMPNTEPVVDNAAVLRSLQQRAGIEAVVPVGFLAAITKGQTGTGLTEMVELAAAGAAGFSDDGVPVADARRLQQALQYQRLCGGVLALHEEDPALSGQGVMHEGAVSALLGLAGIPSISESTMIDRDAQIARYEGGQLHVLHVSAAESVEAVARAKADGVRLTCEVTPHHLTLTDDDVRSLDPRFKMNPPLRGERDRQALIDGLRSGTIDCIATDHAPHSREEKETPFEQAAMGVTGLETAFAALYTELVLPGVIGLPLLVERLTAGGIPYGLAPPTLAAGARANFCLVDLDSAWTVGEAGYESRSENSCFAGRRVSGRVLLTVASGAVAYRERAFSIRLAKSSLPAMKLEGMKPKAGPEGRR
jgi:dihydroorotase